MRVAICLYGLHPDECWKNIKKCDDKCLHYWNQNVFSINNCDIFLHSFSKKTNDLLKYNPIDYIFETENDFKIKENKDQDIEFFENKFNNTKNKNNSITFYNLSQINIIYKVLYGIKSTVKLMTNYENTNNFKYDYVIVSRIDCCWIRPLDFSILEKNKLYSSIWGKNNYYTKNNCGILGYWIISNSALMGQYASLYDNLSFYLKNIKSDYVSLHELFKLHIDTFCNNIEYKFNDIDGNPVDHDLQRYLKNKNII